MLHKREIVANFALTMTNFSLNIHGHLHCYTRPQVMAIINATPDSFYAESRAFDASSVAKRTEQMLAEGADMIDLGAYSSRPGADEVSEQEETDRLLRGIEAVRLVAPDVVLSVDTFRASVARQAVEAGADIINDISGGTLDEAMYQTVASLGVPYVLMHMRGTPATMQQLTDYDDVVVDVTRWLSERLRQLRLLGVADVIVDPGFGFSKTLEQNYALLRALPVMAQALEAPLLVGVSRKSMITRPLGIEPQGALIGTTVVNTLALSSGVTSILRVHDPREARQAITITNLYNQCQ